MSKPNRRNRRGRVRTAVIACATAALLVGTTGCSSEGDTDSLTWYINPDNGGQTTIAEQCTKESGGKYKITTTLLPADAPGQREQLIRRLASQDSSIDIMSLDPVFVAEMAQANYLRKVPAEYQDEFTSGVVQSSIESSTWDDELIAAPFWANTQLLWYRKSVAKAAGLDMSKPVTWDQLIEAAKKQDKELGVQGIRAESLTVWINALVESGGGHIVENPEAEAQDVKLGLDSEAGKKAAEIMSTIGKEGLGGPSFDNQDENGAMLRFQSDNGSFMVNWPFVYTATKAAAESGDVDKAMLDDMAATIYPATTEGKEARPPLGGINLAVSTFSPHEKQAFAAIKCIRSKDNQAQYFVSDGNPPAASEALENDKVKEAFPFADVLKQSLQQSAARPATPYYNEVTGGLQRSWHPAGAINPDSTPAESADLILEILKGERLL